jgi:hypothetical protein
VDRLGGARPGVQTLEKAQHDAEYFEAATKIFAPNCLAVCLPRNQTEDIVTETVNRQSRHVA